MDISYKTAIDPDEISLIFLKKCKLILTSVNTSLLTNHYYQVFFQSDRNTSIHS